MSDSNDTLFYDLQQAVQATTRALEIAVDALLEISNDEPRYGVADRDIANAALRDVTAILRERVADPDPEV